MNAYTIHAAMLSALIARKQRRVTQVIATYRRKTSCKGHIVAFVLPFEAL